MTAAYAPHARKSCTSPYPGLRPFEAHEANIFFGRDDQTTKLLGRLNNSHFLAVVGSSGCGKSSLVRAGMIASLNSGFLGDAGTRWRVAEMRPGDEPLRRLAKALLAPAALGREGDSEGELAFAQATLRRGLRGLTELLEERPLGGANLLILVDQFEEIFRFRREGDADEADIFVNLLLEAAKQRDEPVYVVLTMRSDFLGDCALFTKLPERINDNQFLTPRLERGESEEAIVEPAGVFRGEVEGALVTRLLNDIGPDPARLPILQHTLMRMWAKASLRAAESAGVEVDGEGEDGEPAPILITSEDYEAVGGKDALSRHADEVFYGVLRDDEQRRVAQVMFRRLTERGVGKRDTRRPATVRDVADAAGVTDRQVIEVADVFRKSDRSFVTPPEDINLDKDTKLDIGHESLIWQWGLLNEWVKSEAKWADNYQDLRRAALGWKDGGELWAGANIDRADRWLLEEPRPTPGWATRYGDPEDYALAMQFLDASGEHRERERKRVLAAEADRARAEERARTARKLKWLVIGLALLLLLAGGAGVLALTESRRARIKADEARSKAELLERQNDLVKHQADELTSQTNELAVQKQRAEDAAAEAQKQKAAADENAKAAQGLEKRAEAEAAEAKRQKDKAESAAVVARNQKELAEAREKKNEELVWSLTALQQVKNGGGGDSTPTPAGLLRRIALVSEVDKITPEDLTRVATALQIQIARDFGPAWGIKAEVTVFRKMEDVPVGHWPLIITETEFAMGATAIHEDNNGTPYAQVLYNPKWPMTASHVLLNMLADPFGKRLFKAPSPKPGDDGADVEFLIEPCTPTTSTYQIHDVTVSDFVLPEYYSRKDTAPGKYSFTGAVTEPRQVLKGGYLSWHNPKDDHWWQLTFFFGSKPAFRDLGRLNL